MQERIRSMFLKNNNRLGISAAGMVLFLLLAYLDHPYRIADLFSIYALLVLTSIFVGIYAFFTAICVGLCQKHEGWKRTVILLGVVGGGVGGHIAYPFYDYGVKVILNLLMGFGVGATVSVVLVLLGRWVIDGFQKS